MPWLRPSPYLRGNFFCWGCGRQFHPIINENLPPQRCRTAYCLQCAIDKWRSCSAREREEWLRVAGAPPRELYRQRGDNDIYRPGREVRRRINERAQEIEREIEKLRRLREAREFREQVAEDHARSFGHWREHKGAIIHLVGYEHEGWDFDCLSFTQAHHSAEKTRRYPEHELAPWQYQLAHAGYDFAT